MVKQFTAIYCSELKVLSQKCNIDVLAFLCGLIVGTSNSTYNFDCWIGLRTV